MDQLPRMGKRELICLLSFTCNYVVFVWRGFLFLWVLGMGYVILLWHSLSLPYNYFATKSLPLIDVRIFVLLHILRMHGHNLTKFSKHIFIDKIYNEIIKHHLLQTCNRVTALDLRHLRQNLVFAQYLENE